MQVNMNSINAQFDWMANNSNNIANINSDGYQAIDTTVVGGGSGDIVAVSSKSENSTSLSKELVDQTSISTGVEANVEAINTQDEMVGTLLDMLA